MRTKTLAVCAAVLAAGALSTMAQSNVYSLNIVGYANVGFPAGNTIHANPFDLDGINSASNVFTTLPDGTFVNLWTGSSYDVYVFDSSLGIDPRNWYQSDGTTGRNPPILAPGTGFFINSPSPFTNTFVGNVVPAPNTTNNASLSAGNLLIASRLPVSGSVTNTSWHFPTVDGTFVNKWTGSSYDVYVYDASLGIDPGNWYQSDGTTGRTPPSFNIGEGFFINLPSATIWSQTITNSP